eukprot:NODE_3511_length_2025_cov_6.385669.p1 GENE.NODE_3511_length_2025_cov_6.385669~~NODE_3511_length_2025_cov_6.385669.p1  ORF type:complete len:542 (-),score=170.14 NODE_3511_length_2025_cov_6.385669:144-1769(-)
MHRRALMPAHVRLKLAMSTFCSLAEKGNEHALQALIGCLKDSEAAVRESAIEALGKVARGNKDARAELVKLITNGRGGGRRNLMFVLVAAVEALGEVALTSDEETAACVHKLFASITVKVAHRRAFDHEGDGGDDDDDDDDDDSDTDDNTKKESHANIQMAILVSLRHLTAPKDATLVLDAAISCVMHPSTSVEAGEIAATLASNIDEASLRAVAAHVDGVLCCGRVDAYAYLYNGARRAQVTGLRRLAGLSDGTRALVAERAAPLMEHHWDSVRALGTALAASAALPGDAAMVERLLTLVSDVSPQVVQAATSGLGTVASKGDARAVAALAGCLEHRDGWVRAVAPAALACVAVPGDVTAITALCACAGGADNEAAAAAIKALGGDIGGGERAAAAVAAALMHVDECVRRAAALALQGVWVESGGAAAALSTVTGEVLERWDQDVVVWTSILGALEELAVSGDASAKALLEKAAESDIRSLYEQATGAVNRLESRQARNMCEAEHPSVGATTAAVRAATRVWRTRRQQAIDSCIAGYESE